jgi:ATP-dependent Clp protease ATP-binding subunit ClpX
MAEEFADCSFCGKQKEQVKKLIVGDTSAICSECVDFCQQLLVEDQSTYERPEIDLNPVKIKEFLDKFIIGQTDAKKVIAVAVANHYKRVGNKSTLDLAKANVLLIGPTGCGKTMLAKTVAKYLDVPFAIGDATSLTEAGYVGDDVETLISRLLNNAKGDIEKAQRGIIFIDEIDKISRKSESTSITRDVSGEGVQQALLKLVEGTKCRVNLTGNRKHPSGDIAEVDTSNILFIVGGAFDGLEKIIQRRTANNSIGFGGNLNNKLTTAVFKEVTPDDLNKYGLIPELIGRFTNTVALEELSTQDLIHVLSKVDNNLIEQYRYLFKLDDIKLDVTKDAVEAIAKRTQALKTGARGLHTELERTLMPHMYNVQNYRQSGIKDVTIDTTQVNTPAMLTNKELNGKV